MIACMIDYPKMAKGCVQCHGTSFKFCEMSDDISETLQDRETYM